MKLREKYQRELQSLLDDLCFMPSMSLKTYNDKKERIAILRLILLGVS